MDAFMDLLWLKIVTAAAYGKGALDIAFSPLHALGPAVAIFIIALLTVAITKLLSRTFVTRRYKELKENFRHWYHIRQEALKCDEGEEGRRLARNIDQSELNRLYYDYFFEGFMLGLATRVLPIMIILAYVNEAFQPDRLAALFNQPYIFQLGAGGESPLPVGSVFWFVLSILLVYIGWGVIKKLYQRNRPTPQTATAPAA